MGSRYGGLKQLDRVGPAGETMIDYAVFDAHRAGFDHVVFVIREDFADEFKSKIGSKYESMLRVTYVFQDLDDLPAGFTKPAERTKPWGTGHAILAARDCVDAPFAVINADDFYGRDGMQACSDFLMQAHTRDATAFCMVGYRLHNTLSPNGTVSRGLCRCDAQGMLEQVTETHGIEQRDGQLVSDDPKHPGLTIALEPDSVVSMNLWGLTPVVFEHLQAQFEAFLQEKIEQEKSEFYIPAVIDQMIRNQEATVRVETCESPWFGVTYQADKPFVEQSIRELVEAGAYPSPLWS